jgi:peptidoglycan/xylan/chitin deacetylase (PgdA/CDA1 family)
MKIPNIPIVMYHSVNDPPDDNPLRHLSVTPVEFECHLRAVRAAGFQFVTMRGLWEMAQTGDLATTRAAVLTFDDGYLDNWLNAKPILEAFDANATVFVSPGFVAEGRARTRDDVPNGWGYLNWDELRLMESSGRFDVQSHTLTHDHGFLGSRLVDVYTADRFEDYYWLTWLLAPETKHQWQGDVRRFASVVPDGFPIFEHGRALSGRQFLPANDFVEQCLARFRQGGREAVLRTGSVKGSRGKLETPAEYEARIDREVTQSKEIIENRLGHTADFICFPGGAYSDEVLRHTAHAGYKTYFLSSRHAGFCDNRLALSDPPGSSGPVGLVPLKRISFTRDYPRWALPKSAAYWNARLKIHAFLEPSRVGPLLKAARGLRNGARRLGVS